MGDWGGRGLELGSRGPPVGKKKREKGLKRNGEKVAKRSLVWEINFP